MSAEGLIVTLTLLVIVILWVGSPFLRRGAAQRQNNLSGQRERLLTDYERVMNNLRDLDEDQATGKIQPDTYEQEREQVVQRGVQILMALDQLEGDKKRAKAEKPEAVPAAQLERAEGSVDDAIEAAVLARRKKIKTHTRGEGIHTP